MINMSIFTQYIVKQNILHKQAIDNHVINRQLILSILQVPTRASN